MSVNRKSMNEYREIEWENFIAEFKPLRNPLDENASYEGFMFETYGEEFKAVQAAAVDVNRRACIWTVVDGEGDELVLVNGLHYVNRFGYVITDLRCPDNQLITVL